MKITVLGSGSAFGMPMIFNTWKNANPNNPKNRRTRASLFLEEKAKSILIDAGPDLLHQINANNIKNIDSVFITHGHYDHIGGLPELTRASKILEHSIEIYANLGTLAELKKCYGYLFNDDAEADPESRNLIWKELPDDGKFIASGLEFETLLFPHHSIFSSAFRYKNFAYVTDWAALPPKAYDFLKNLDLLVIECNNGTEELDNGHSNLSVIKALKEKINPKKMVLSHLSARVDSRDLSKLLPSGCELSYDAMGLEA